MESHNQKGERWLDALACMADGVILTDLNGIIDFINDAALNLSGWKSEDITGKDFSKVFPVVNSYTHEPVKCPIEIVLESKIATSLSKNNTVIFSSRTESYAEASFSPIKNVNNVIIGVVVVLHNITCIGKTQINLQPEHSVGKPYNDAYCNFNGFIGTIFDIKQDVTV